jgi:hypothetical protein
MKIANDVWGLHLLPLLQPPFFPLFLIILEKAFKILSDFSPGSDTDRQTSTYSWLYKI